MAATLIHAFFNPRLQEQLGLQPLRPVGMVGGRAGRAASYLRSLPAVDWWLRHLSLVTWSITALIVLSRRDPTSIDGYRPIGVSYAMRLYAYVDTDSMGVPRWLVGLWLTLIALQLSARWFTAKSKSKAEDGAARDLTQVYAQKLAELKRLQALNEARASEEDTLLRRMNRINNSAAAQGPSTAAQGPAPEAKVPEELVLASASSDSAAVPVGEEPEAAAGQDAAAKGAVEAQEAARKPRGEGEKTVRKRKPPKAA